MRTIIENKEFLLDYKREDLIKLIQDLTKSKFNVIESNEAWEVSIGNSIMKCFLTANITVECLGDKSKVIMQVDRAVGTNPLQGDDLKRAFRKIKKNSMGNCLVDLIIDRTY